MKKLLFVVALTLIGLTALAAQVPSWRFQNAGPPAPGARPVGHDPQGQSLYLAVVATAPLRLGYLDPSDPRAWIFDNQSVTPVNRFDTYIGPGRWIPASADHLPPDAITVGGRAGGNPLYILRVSSQGWLIPAFYSSAEHAAVTYINGQRLLFSTFEVLVPAWIPADSSQANTAFHAANDSDGSPLVPLRVVVNHETMIGKYNLGSRKAYFPGYTKEIENHSPGQQIFAGTGVWRHFDGQVPQGAIPAGIGPNRSYLYMIRATVPGTNAQSLGYLRASDSTAKVSYGGRAYKVDNFEVLCYNTAPQVPQSVMVENSAPAQTTLPTTQVPITAPLTGAPITAPLTGGPVTGGPVTTQQSAPQQPPAPQPLQDRSVAPTEIQTEYGYAKIDGQLSIASGIKNGTYVDSYVYHAAKGEKFMFAFGPTNGAKRANFVDHVSDPSGNQLGLTNRGAGQTLKVESAQPGDYTLTIAAADPSNLGSYEVFVYGKGKRFSGNLDPFNSPRDGTNMYSQIHLSSLTAGMYRFDLTDNFKSPELRVQDSAGNVVAHKGVAPGVILFNQSGNLSAVARLKGGDYNVDVEDGLNGGGYSLMVTFLGPGS